MTDKSARTWMFLIIVVVIFAGLWGYQRNYIAHHAPLIKEGLAAAQVQGAGLLEQIGLPPGAVPVDPVMSKTTMGTSEGVWEDTPCGVMWTGSWDAPGDHAGMLSWYDQRLRAQGWSLYNQRIPTSLETLYWKDKWLLTIQHNVDFKQEHRARIALRLEWDYWHRLEKTSAEYAK